MAYFLKGLVISLAILAHCYIRISAKPLVSNTQLAYDIDDDDTEVIEIDLNSIDELVGNDTDRDIIDLSFYGNAIYGAPDNESTAQLVANYTPETASVNPEELGSYLEGDILVPMQAGAVLTKNGLTTQSSRWPNGIVPYEIRGQFSARDRATIELAIEQYHQRTCIRFVPRTTERDYISIVSGNSGCWSSVGRVGGRQEVNLQSPGCITKPGTPMHELMHAVGFLHEQNRHERDSFVSIQYQNVQPHAVSNFEKASRTNAFGVPYDYGSVMHYSANAFSSNGRPTIVAVQPGGNEKMGQRDGFSAYDVEKLNKMYNCGYGGNAPMPAPAPAPAPAPGPMPAPVPVPMPGAGVGGGGGGPPNALVGSFLGGLLSGLGLAEQAMNTTTLAPAV